MPIYQHILIAREIAKSSALVELLKKSLKEVLNKGKVWI